jgi:tripartite-type tricarboxylate transporter receptor subunit TctC
MITRRSLLIAGSSLVPLATPLVAARVAHAQGAAAPATAWPTRPVALIIPFPAGGAMDLLGRAVAQDLGDKLGQQFVVDNRAGAAGNIGAMAAAKATPDGYTILMAGAASLALNKFMFGSMQYDPEKELTPIVIVSRLPHIFVVNPKVEATTLKQLVDYTRANPGKLNAGVPGTGTTAHITLEAFMAETGARMTVVTYRAEPQMLTDLVGGQLDFACTLTTSPGPHVQAGRLRALAVTSATRTQQLPDVPTVEQAGFPGFEATACAGRADRDADGDHRPDQHHHQCFHPQRQGQAGSRQARFAAGGRDAGRDQGLHCRRGPQVGAHHQGGEDSDVSLPASC